MHQCKLCRLKRRTSELTEKFRFVVLPYLLKQILFQYTDFQAVFFFSSFAFTNQSISVLMGQHQLPYSVKFVRFEDLIKVSVPNSIWISYLPIGSFELTFIWTLHAAGTPVIFWFEFSDQTEKKLVNCFPQGFK